MAVSGQLLDFEIVGREERSGEVVLLDLRGADGAVLPTFTAGSHIDLHLSGDIVRQYSLWNDPAERHRYCIAVRRIDGGRGGSRAAHTLATGARLKASSPRNVFPLKEDAHHSILLAGGIGVTPLLSMAHRLAHVGTSFELHYRTRRGAGALDEVIAAAPWADRLRRSYSGEVAFDFSRILARPEDGTHVYVCGPSSFMAAALAAAAHWPSGTVHSETFAPIVDRAGGDTFMVRVGKNGPLFPVPANRSIIEVLSEQGVIIPTACEQGICGTCQTGVIDGIPDHRDLCLTADQHASNAFITPCCSRSRSDVLTLDL